ncbi:MAG: PEP/pyruvate-binding domain-containing protein [Eubacteriales bacterium]
MDVGERISTGISGFDNIIDGLRLGDNVVWQTDSVEDYIRMARPFAQRALRDGRRLIYVRFGRHEAVLPDSPDTEVVHVDASKGFEHFATSVHRLVEKEGLRAFYVFDCLSELLEYWHSDLMIGNFFKVACPFLFELDTIAYFALIRNRHTYNTIAGIRETTQLLLDLYNIKGRYYIHPLKVWQRYSPTMFLPHLISGEDAVSVTSSADAAELFSSISPGEERLDYWNVIFSEAKSASFTSDEEQAEHKRFLLSLLTGERTRMSALCDKYLTLTDVLAIASRVLGSGCIGGKSVGMLAARKILETQGGERFTGLLEPHDSFYIGSDVFYTYIVQNGWWKLRVAQKTSDGYFSRASELRELLRAGRFPANIREKFLRMLEYFGSSPIIVRSSSLLEDNFGNAFAGKYESVFLVNQGAPEERYAAFEQAVRDVYASTMDEDALSYRAARGLIDRDEQMAVLVQRVSGSYYGDYFFPHAAGVGNSSNLYVWDKSVDMDAGMLRLVLGLGTRAVDRTEGDHVRIVRLDEPTRQPPVDYRDRGKYSQHRVDVLSLRDNKHTSLPAEQVLSLPLGTDASLFASQDLEIAARLRELNITDRPTPYILDFDGLLGKTSFPAVMRDMLALLSGVYDYPVDIEFTVNFERSGAYKINLLQCRPLQTRGLGEPVCVPSPEDGEYFFTSKGGFMGGNVRLPVDYVIYVDPKDYLELTESDKYCVARLIGQLNTNLKGHSVLLCGPGRWGTTTPSLGVPVRFAEISGMCAICEVASEKYGFTPELSYGSHFFQDLVESGIFYAALFDGRPDVSLNADYVTRRDNLLPALVPTAPDCGRAVHVARVEGMELYSSISEQTLLCR